MFPILLFMLYSEENISANIQRVPENVHYNKCPLLSARYIEIFQKELDRDSTSSKKNYPP